MVGRFEHQLNKSVCWPSLYFRIAIESEMMRMDDAFFEIPVMETPRLILRKAELGDITDLYEYASNPLVTKYTTWEHHKTMDATKQFILYLLDRYAKKKVADWGMVHKETQKFIGTCGFTGWDIEHSKAGIGYAMNPTFWGKGLMTEAVKALIDFGFIKMKLNRIEATCTTENIGSRRVMEKVGMRREATLRQALFFRGKFVDKYIYAILRNDVGIRGELIKAKEI